MICPCIDFFRGVGYNYSNKLEKGGVQKMKRVSVITKNRFLFQKIRLELSECEVTLGESDGKCDVRLVDLDTAEPIDDAISMSRYGACDVSLPFALGTLNKIIEEGEGDKTLLSLDFAARCANLYGEKIRLTDVEFSLLSLLYAAGGEYVGRREILRKVWNNACDEGVINVYIHYLREKLEVGGEKIILSSRKLGYAVNSKFLKGEKVCSE